MIVWHHARRSRNDEIADDLIVMIQTMQHELCNIGAQQKDGYYNKGERGKIRLAGSPTTWVHKVKVNCGIEGIIIWE